MSQDDALDVFLGRLPSEFPTSLCPGRQHRYCHRGCRPGAGVRFFETDASSEDLLSFYEDELDEDRITSISRGDQNVIRFDVEGDGTAQVIVDEFQAGEDDVELLHDPAIPSTRG